MIYAGKLAFSYILGHNTDLSWGVEYNHVDGSGKLTTNTGSIPSSDYSNKEDKFALYAELSAQIGHVGISGGIRYEDLISEYVDHVDLDGNVHRHYRNVSIR